MNHYNTFWQRVGAALIDGMALGLLVFLAKLILNLYTNESEIVGRLLDNIFYFCYSFYLHGRFGQTFGKMAFSIKVVLHDDESQAIGFHNAFKRESVWIFLTAISYIPVFRDLSFVDSITFFWFLAEIITMLFNEKRRAVHDYLANSVVIDIRSYTKWEQSFYTEQKIKPESNDQ